MEIIGIDEKSGVIFFKAGLNEFANFAGFSYYSSIKYSEVQVGNTIEVGQCYLDAKEVLELHEKARSAAKQLKTSSTRFLSFFRNKEEK